jgi:hypothetical protein
MKPFIFKIGFFTLIILLFFTALNIFQGQFNNSPEQFKLKYEEIKYNKQKANGIIIGTSHAAHSIRPSLLDSTGINFYNFALNGSNPIFYSHWFNEIFLKEYPKPRYCIFAVDWFMFDEKWLWRTFEQDAEYFPFRIFISCLFKFNDFNKKDLFLNRFPATKYRKSIKRSLKLQKGDSLYQVSEYDRGYIPANYPFDSLKFQSKKNIQDIEISAIQVNHFEKLIHQLDSLGICIIFIMTPEYHIEKSDYSQMESIKIIERVSLKYNIPFLNFNTNFRTGINEDINNFVDWGHMSKTGSIVFSKLLADKIRFISLSQEPPLCSVNCY